MTGPALLFLLFLFVVSIILALLPWLGRVRTSVLIAIPLASLALVAYVHSLGSPASFWSPLIWLVTLGPGSLIAVVRLVAPRRRRDRGSAGPK